MKRNNQKLTKLVALMVSLMVLTFTMPVQAAALSSIQDTMTRQKIATLSSHTITFALSGANTLAANDTITIDFGEDTSGFVVGGATSAIADFDFNDGTERTIAAVNTGAPTCSVGVNNVAVGIDDTTGIVTIQACSTYTASAAGATVTIKYGTAASVGGAGANRVTNPAAKGTYIVPLSVTGTPVDSGSFAVSIPEASGDDQIPVTSVVAPSITFTVTNTTLDLGTISTSAGTFSANNTITIGTNANNGYTITILDAGNGASPGLYASAISQLIASNSVDLASVSGYGGQCHKTSGSGSCSGSFPDNTGTTVGALAVTPATFASYGTKPAGTDNFQVRVGARVSSSQEAGVYTDTLTMLGTANF